MPHSPSNQTGVDVSPKATSSSPKASALYPLQSISNSLPILKSTKEPYEVRTLYDFEAAEDNELTFKAGEIILVLDDSDQNWWHGSNQRGGGLFPANFVTDDLSSEAGIKKRDKKTVAFNDEVTIKTLDPEVEVEINEAKIDKMLNLLHEADPTGEVPDDEELLRLEEHCIQMGPLIDQQLEQIDRDHASLVSSVDLIVGSLNNYQILMKDYNAMPYAQYQVPHSYSMTVPSQAFPQHHLNQTCDPQQRHILFNNLDTSSMSK